MVVQVSASPNAAHADRLEAVAGATFTWAPYVSPDAAWRNHCVFCWAPFGEAHRTEGYVTSVLLVAGDQDSLWICDACFADHQDSFGWRVSTSPTSG